MNARKYLLLTLVSVCFPAFAQSPATPGNASSTLAQLQSVFSGGKPVTNVQLTGTATWHAGSLEDTGPATLTASSMGAAQMQLLLAKSGERSEKQDSIGPGMTCQWSTDGQPAQPADAMNCWKGAVWFLPAISLQAAAIPASVGIADYGMETDSSGTVHHLQSQLVLANLPADMTTKAMQESTIDIGLDPASLLPARVSYKVHPDNGASLQLPIEVRFSNYKKVSGVEVPFLIQRYVNGSLQLEIDVQSAQIN